MKNNMHQKLKYFVGILLETLKVKNIAKFDGNS